MVEVGQTAPDFIAPAVSQGEAFELELFRLIEDHDAVALLWYPADFVPTCTADLTGVRDAGWHEIPNLAVVGISGDSLFAHAAYADRFDLPIPLVSDFHGSVADSYGLLADAWEAHSRIPRRGAVVVDGDWEVRFVETTTDALEQADPAPVERAAEALGDIGIDVERPTVDYRFDG